MNILSKFQDNRNEFIQEISETLNEALKKQPNFKEVMLTGSHSTGTALKGVSDIDFWFIMIDEEANMEEDILDVLRKSKYSAVHSVDKRGRILLVLDLVSEQIDISVIPESNFGPERMILVQGMLMKKTIMVYMESLDIKQKKMFKEVVLSIKMIKFLNSLENLPGFCIELVVLYSSLRNKPATLKECLEAVHENIVDDEQTLCFSGGCDVCIGSMKPSRFFIKICIGGVVRYMDGLTLFLVIKEKVAHTLVNKVKTDDEAVLRTSKMLKVLTDQITTQRMPSCKNLKDELLEDALVDVDVETIKKALKKIGITQDSKTGYNTRSKKQKK